MASRTAPCSPTRTRHLIRTGCLALLKEGMPQVRHSAQKAECSPCLPSAERHPLHQQDQSSPHLRCSSTQLQPPETLGHCHCYPCPTWSKTAPGWGPDGSTTLAGWHLLFRLTIWAQLRSWEGWWSGAGGQVPPACLHLPPPFL